MRCHNPLEKKDPFTASLEENASTSESKLMALLEEVTLLCCCIPALQYDILGLVLKQRHQLAEPRLGCDNGCLIVITQ